MKLTLDLDTASSIALRRLANELRCSEEEAAVRALREALIGTGLLEPGAEVERDGEVEGQV